MQPTLVTIAGTRLEVEPVVATFEIWPLDEALPFPCFELTVVHKNSGGFQATPNVSVRNVTTGDIEYTCGLGQSINDAVHEAIRFFLKEAQEQSKTRELGEDDFVWNPARTKRERPGDGK